MKLAVGKSIYGEDVAGIFTKPALKFEKCAGMAQLHGGPLTQAQANGKGLVRTDLLADCQGVILQGKKRLRPVLATMDIRAIGKVERMIQLHVRKDKMRPNSGFASPMNTKSLNGR